jgi:hypothetical protein
VRQPTAMKRRMIPNLGHPMLPQQGCSRKPTRTQLKKPKKLSLPLSSCTMLTNPGFVAYKSNLTTTTWQAPTNTQRRCAQQPTSSPTIDQIFDQVNGTTGGKARIPEGRDQTKTMTTYGEQMVWESHTYTEHTKSAMPMLARYRNHDKGVRRRRTRRSYQDEW